MLKRWRERRKLRSSTRLTITSFLPVEGLIVNASEHLKASEFQYKLAASATSALHASKTFTERHFLSITPSCNKLWHFPLGFQSPCERVTCIVAKCAGLGPRTTNTFYMSVWQPQNPGYRNAQCVKHTLVSWNIRVLKLICKNQRTSLYTLADKSREEPGLREKQG